MNNFVYACEVRVCCMVCLVLARTQGDFTVLAHRVSTPQTSVPLPQSIILIPGESVKANGKENSLSHMWSERDSNSQR